MFGRSTSSTYTSEFANKCINLESLLQVYFRVSSKLHKFSKSTSEFENKHINIESPLILLSFKINLHQFRKWT